MTLSRDSVPGLSRGVGFRRIGDKGVILVAETSKAIVINETGARILELTDGKRTVAQIVAVLSEEFDARPAVLEAEVESFLEKAQAARMLVTVPGGSDAA
jgi:coenzyme PQQ biosynthesis protein PqqD